MSSSMIISVVSPLIILIIYSIYEIKSQKFLLKIKKFYKFSLYTASIFLFIQLLTYLVFQLIGLLSCRQVGKNQYILINMNYMCYTQTHNFCSKVLVLRFLLLWVVVLPTILFIKIYISKQKHTLNRAVTNLKYGFLYQEYQEQAYYREFIKIIQKMAIVLILNFYSQYIIIKGILVYIVILFYEVFATKMKTYKIDQLNQIDIYSTKICPFTLYSIFEGKEQIKIVKSESSAKRKNKIIDIKMNQNGLILVKSNT
ncbi:hypothetical protein ABPG72_007829 [Tetrahymena utriculariae]